MAYLRISVQALLLSFALVPFIFAQTTEVAMIDAPGDWPRWRGPSGQGLVADSGYPDAWSATRNVRWKVEVPGRGNSSPIVWGDRIFLTTSGIPKQKGEKFHRNGLL